MAAAVGVVGPLKRDTMAMQPFIGYYVAYYFRHWLVFGKTIDEDKRPLIFTVNWFRQNEEGKFMWPGFGENFRVIEWILRRCDGQVSAHECEIGYLPEVDDICLEGMSYELGGKPFDRQSVEDLLEVNREVWRAEAQDILAFYETLGERVPQELLNCLNELCDKLGCATVERAAAGC